MNTKKPKLIIVSGPTATGKTQTSIQIAQYLKTLDIQSAIVNFDSLLFYKELNIGTAKPTAREQEGIPHFLINNCSIKTALNASEYRAMALEEIEKLKQENKTVILVGGSGFYLRALIKGMYETKEIPQSFKDEIKLDYQNKGIGFIRSFLEKNDPTSFNQLHENDHYRNIRAFEYFKYHNISISLEKIKAQTNNPYDFSRSKFDDWDILHFYLDIDKDLHQKIIQERTYKMIKDGLILEVSSLLEDDLYSGEEKPLSSIGYKETIQYLNSSFKNKEEYMQRIIISTRQLAKAQRTFFNKVTPKEKINPLKDQEKLYQKLDDFITLNSFPSTSNT